MSMSDVLMLFHRLPFPPNKGDKIRAFHILKQVARSHRVHVGCFVDDPDDRQHVSSLDEFCTSKCVVEFRPEIARIKSSKGFLTNESLSVPYYSNRAMRDWVRRTLSENDITTIIAYSSPMAQYVLGPEFESYRRLMDFVDVDSDKWRQYSKKTRWPARWLYQREADRLLDFERRVAKEFDAVALVTQNEVDLFDELSPETRDKHHSVCNGVAMDFFDPAEEFANPFDPAVKPIVFTGMMNYWPNIDAVSWFARDVFPHILAQEPSARFWIVGASPTREVEALAGLDGVQITGRVPDVRPYLKHAAFVVAPLRIARGIQNKVLEAMSMNCRVLCSQPAASGLIAEESAPFTLAESAPELVSRSLELLADEGEKNNGYQPRDYVQDHYDWQTNLSWFEELSGMPHKADRRP